MAATASATEKSCTACGVVKPLTAFSLHSTGRHGRHPWCKTCKNSRASGSYGRWTDEQRGKHRTRILRMRYGITLKELEDLYIAQKGRCAICDRVGLQPSSTSKRGRRGGVLVIDHDHAMGTVRGLLCTGCNLAVGYLRDDPALFRSAADYLGGGI